MINRLICCADQPQPSAYHLHVWTIQNEVLIHEEYDSYKPAKIALDILKGLYDRHHTFGRLTMCQQNKLVAYESRLEHNQSLHMPTLSPSLRSILNAKGIDAGVEMKHPMNPKNFSSDLWPSRQIVKFEPFRPSIKISKEIDVASPEHVESNDLIDSTRSDSVPMRRINVPDDFSSPHHDNRCSANLIRSPILTENCEIFKDSKVTSPSKSTSISPKHFLSSAESRSFVARHLEKRNLDDVQAPLSPLEYSTTQSALVQKSDSITPADRVSSEKKFIPYSERNYRFRS